MSQRLSWLMLEVDGLVMPFLAVRAFVRAKYGAAGPILDIFH